MTAEKAAGPRHTFQNGQVITEGAEGMLADLFDGLTVPEAVSICSRANSLEELFRDLHAMGREKLRNARMQLRSTSDAAISKQEEGREPVEVSRGEADAAGNEAQSEGVQTVAVHGEGSGSAPIPGHDGKPESLA